MFIKRLKPCCLFDVFRRNNCLTMTLSITVFLFLSITQTGAQEGQLIGPENTLGFLGSNVTLKCTSPFRGCSEIYWWKQGSSPMAVFRDGHGIYSTFKDRYSVDNSSGCDLVVRNVELGDAGQFICQAIISSNTVDKSAYLTILDTEPQCTTNVSQNDTVEQDQVRLNCFVSFDGTLNASMEWDGVTDAPNALVQGKNTSRSFIINAFVPEVPSYTCITSFPYGGQPIIGLAPNVPKTTCKTSVIKVLYSVRDVTLSPSFSNYLPGTPITCAAKGHPSPTFKWQETDDNGIWKDIKNGSEFTGRVVSSKRYRCVAMNVVRGQNFNDTSDEFQVNNSGASNTPVTTTLPFDLIVAIGAGVGVGFLLLVIILLVVCFCVRCCPGYKCCHSQREKIREERPLTENPDIYANVNDAPKNGPKAKPRSVKTSEPPKLPQTAPPKAKPRTDNQRAAPANAYPHEEVTYAELARDNAPCFVAPKNNHMPQQQETLYADVGTA